MKFRTVVLLNVAVIACTITARAAGDLTGYDRIAIGNQETLGGSYTGITSGESNRVDGGSWSVISGGHQNVLQDANESNISGGARNKILDDSYQSSISGGGDIVIDTNCPYSWVGGGTYHKVFSNAHYATICGGWSNVISTNNWYSTIGGGNGNLIWTNAGTSVICGGGGNKIDGNANTAFIGAGSWGYIGYGCGGAAIVNGYANSNSSANTFVGSGSYNRIGTNSNASAILSGEGNWLMDNSLYSIIANGYHQFLNGAGYSAISGGYYNSIFDGANYSTIGGGGANIIGSNAVCSVIPGGQYAKAAHSGCFVFGDNSVYSYVTTTTPNQFLARAQNVTFTSGNAGTAQTVSWTPGTGNWSFTSDRETKERFSPVDTETVLEKLDRIPITEWNYKGYPQRHIGPVAQDFHAEFPLNDNDKMLNSADLQGVALAAIQGLHKAVKAKDEQIAQLQKRLAAVEEGLEKRSKEETSIPEDR